MIVSETFSRQLLPITTQTLTMHFEGQRLGEAVLLSHIFSVGQTAVGPLIAPSYIAEAQDWFLFLPPEITNAPISETPSLSPPLHVLGWKEKQKEIRHIRDFNLTFNTFFVIYSTNSGRTIVLQVYTRLETDKVYCWLFNTIYKKFSL